MLNILLKRRPRWAALASLVLGLAGLLSGCVDPYAPPVLTAPQSYLVVDGFINLQGRTTVRLTRTRNLSDNTGAPAEAGASVAVQDEAGARYPLVEQAAGTYASPALTLPAGRRYQLRLRTAAGREYASDLVAAKVSPAIDDVAWAVEPAGIQISVDTHDAANDTRYYRWSFEETWEFYSAYQSSYEYVNGRIVPRTENINHCWHEETSHAIILHTTKQLSQDVVTKFPLTRLATTSERLGVRYSILVQQHAQTQEEFTYWDNLRKNSENLGTLFDPLPSQISGNVHSLSEASELVLGYVGAGSVTERRLFIARPDLPLAISNSRFVTGYEDCVKLDSVQANDAQFYFGDGAYLPLFPATSALPPTVYTAATPACADCRLRGTNVKPSYWP